MRLLHTADWHLGRLLHRVPLLDAQRAVLDGLVDLARAEEVDAILLAGDVFDRALPPVEAVRVAGDALRRLAEVAPVVAISGNHDSAGRLGFAAELIAAGGVHLRTEPLRAGEPVVLQDEHGPVAIYALPYLDPNLTREPLGVAERSHEAVLGAAMARVREDLAGRDGHRAVVVAHAFVQGGEASESERDISVGGAQTVPASVFDGVAYAALGHLHRPHAVAGGDVGTSTAGARAADGTAAAHVTAGEETAEGASAVADAASHSAPDATTGGPRGAGEAHEAAALGGLFAALAEEPPAPAPPPAPAAPTGARAVVRYAGSPLAYSFTEADAAKSTAIVELGPDGVRDVRLVPVPSPFRLVRLRGELEALLTDPAHAAHEAENAWLEVTLTDARLPARPMERLRRRFPRVLVLQHAPEGELAPATVAAARVQGRSDLEVLERFVADVRGEGPTDEERPLLRDAVERVARRSEED